MHGNTNERRALEREALRNVISQWNANRWDIFELTEPNEDLEFHGVMRFYFQETGENFKTKCIRVASDATVDDVVSTLVEKFRPDMRMLTMPTYGLYELHEGSSERRMPPDEKPLLIQLNWHVDDREGRFLLKNIDDKTSTALVPTSSDPKNASFRRKLSKREKKQLKKQEKLARMKSENGSVKNGVVDKLYTELPETSFTRSISNPEAVMRRRRQQKLEHKLQQFRSKDGRPDTGGTLKIYGEALCKDVPYKTLLVSVRDCAGTVVREMLEKYGLQNTDPSQWCLVQVTQQPGGPDLEYVLDDDECPLSILMNCNSTSSIMFHVRRRPTDSAPRKRKKKPGVIGGSGASGGGSSGVGSSGTGGDCRGASSDRDLRSELLVPLLIELSPDGTPPNPADTSKTVRLSGDLMEVGSANGIALQLYGPHIQPRHCVITNSEGVVSVTPCHADASIFINGQRIQQTTLLVHGSVIRFGHSSTYRFLDPAHEERTRHAAFDNNHTRLYDSRSPRALSPTEQQHSRENIETTFDLDGNVETISMASGAREDNRSVGSTSENRMSGIDHRYPRGRDPILPAVLEFPEEPQDQFLAHVITHLDVSVPTSFPLAPAFTLYLCARYRASTHYRPELTPTERAHKLTVILQHAAILIRHTIQESSTECGTQAFWLANASELLHFLKSDRHVSAFSVQAQDTLADAVQLAFRNMVSCLTEELQGALTYLMAATGDDHPREVVSILSGGMVLLRKCRVNAALTIQLFSQLFHWVAAKALGNVITNGNLCTRLFGTRLFNRLRNLQIWAESQGLELAAECHLAKIVQCAHLLQAAKYTPEDLATLSSVCFKLNSLQLGALLMQYKPEASEKLAPQAMLEQAAKAAETVSDELVRAEGRDVTLYEDPVPALQLLLPDDGFSCDVVQGVPPGLADFLHPLQAAGLCRLAAQPTSSGHWTVYMTAPRPPSSLSANQPEVQLIRLHKAGGGMGLSIVAAKGAGQERLGIYIKSVVPGGAADRDSRLQAGDQLLSVDGQSLLGITQEKAAEFLVRTGSVVTLEVAKGGAVYHGLATLLQQPSPQPHRGSRRMSERDLPSRVDAEQQRAVMPTSKSVPALHHISSSTSHLPEPQRNTNSVANNNSSASNSNPTGSSNSNDNFPPPQIPDYISRPNPSINSVMTNGPNVLPNGGGTPNAYRSRSTHNLNQSSDTGFYQNLSPYNRGKMPSPQQQQQYLGDRSSTLRSSQNSLQSSIISQRPSPAYFNNNNSQSQPVPMQSQHILNRPNHLPNLKSSLGTTAPLNNGIRQPPLQMNNSGHFESAPLQQYHYSSSASSNSTALNNNANTNYHQPSPNNISSSSNNGSMMAQQYPNNTYNNNGNGAVIVPDVLRYPEMRVSRSEDYLKQQYHNNSHHHQPNQLSPNPMTNGGDVVRYTNNNNNSSTKTVMDQNHLMRGQAKLLEMSEEVRRRQNRPPPASNYYHHQQQQQQITQNLQALHLNKSQPPVAPPKPNAPQQFPKKSDINNFECYAPPELPPTSTHPLYSASSHDPPKMALYPSSASASSGKPPARDPWMREEQERRAEVRREVSRQWQEQQIRDLIALPNRSTHQDEQLRVLQLEREFQRRAMEAANEQQIDDDDIDKELMRSSPGGVVGNQDEEEEELRGGASSPPPPPLMMHPSILKAAASIGGTSSGSNGFVQHPNEQQLALPPPPPPPERGSSFAIMSMRQKESAKKVSFNDVSAGGGGTTSAQPPPPPPSNANISPISTSTANLQLDEVVREDPNKFFKQAESMLASPTTPTDENGGTVVSGAGGTPVTPGVIGAQEVYRDPRTRRLAEQAQQKNQTVVPEKLSFKEKMKMFAMETGEPETPRDKSKISRAQRDIDNLGSPNSGLVH